MVETKADARRSNQRMVRALDADYNRALARLQKWTGQAPSLQSKITALEKDLKATECKLAELTKGAYMSFDDEGILDRVVKGETMRAIAVDLGLSPATVANKANEQLRLRNADLYATRPQGQGLATWLRKNREKLASSP